MTRLIVVCALFALLYLFQLTLCRCFWKKGLQVNIAFAQNHIFQGEQGQLLEVIENRKRLPIAMLKVKFRTDRSLDFGSDKGSKTTDKYYRYDVFHVGGGERVRRTLPFVGTKRGYYVIDGMDLVVSDLFLYTNYMQSVPGNSELYVYPKPFDSEQFLSCLTRLNGEILVRRNFQEDPFEYRGLREYQPSDSMRDINWKATARTGELMVNLKNHTSVRIARIFMNLRGEGIFRQGDCVEAAIRMAAGLCSAFLSQGMEISCYGNGRDALTGNYVVISQKSGNNQMDLIYRTLARIDTDKEPGNFAETMGDRLLDCREDSVTCLISPGYSDDFLQLLRQYAGTGRDYCWFYPLAGGARPNLPEDVAKYVQFIRI